MMKRLYVFIPQMALKGSLFPLCRDEAIIFHADYSELDKADKGDLFVVHRGRLLHAIMTALDDTIMVEMPADSAFDEQPLRD